MTPIRMAAAIPIIITSLTAGMTTGKTTANDYFVKTWYTGEPLDIPSLQLPAGAVYPVQQQAGTQYAGEDTITLQLRIKFYQLAARKAADAQETAQSITRLMAMVDQMHITLRTDPTFTAQFIMSGLSTDYQLGGEIYRYANTLMTLKSRALWGA